MNRVAFYAALRRRGSGVFEASLSEPQVAVLAAILDQTTGLPRAHIAYIMATPYHETGSPRMVPSVENLHYTTTARIRQVWPKRFPTDASAAPMVRNARALANQVYNGRLGNRDGSDDGWMFRGRGLDHLTGRENYERLAAIVGVDVVGNPDLMLRPDVSVKSLVHGLTTGRYTGKKLADYGGAKSFDFVQARAVVNGDVRANGPIIAGYARGFEAALAAAGLA